MSEPTNKDLLGEWIIEGVSVNVLMIDKWGNNTNLHSVHFQKDPNKLFSSEIMKLSDFEDGILNLTIRRP